MSTLKCLLCQNVYCAKKSAPKMSVVAKCLLWQNVDSQNVYLAKMFTVPKCPLLKCQLSRLKQEGPFRKETSLIYKEFCRHFGSLLKTLQPVLTVYNEFVFWKMYFTNCLLSYCPSYMHEGMYTLYTLTKRS